MLYTNFHGNRLLVLEMIFEGFLPYMGVVAILVMFVCLLSGLRFYVPVNTISVMSGRSHGFLGITSTFWEVNVSCSRIQHSDLSEDRTP